MHRSRFGVPIFGALGLSAALAASPGLAFGQGKELPPMKVNLPPSPNFDLATAPEKHPTGEFSVFGLRKSMKENLDKDVQVKGYLLYLYECPPEIRKCNEEQDARAKRARRRALPGAPVPEETTTCRPCDQPHFFISDKADGKLERALLVADYPLKDWKTNRPKALDVKQGEQYVVTGTFAINSITGFAASNGLLIHKRTQDAEGKMVAEGNAVLPPEAQTIQLEGKPPEQLVPVKGR